MKGQKKRGLRHLRGVYLAKNRAILVAEVVLVVLVLGNTRRNMASNHNAEPSSPPISDPLGPEPQEWPEWIDRLRRRILAESPKKQAWAEKAGMLIIELMDLSEKSLGEAAAASDNYTAMLRAMSSPEKLFDLQEADPLAGAFIRGLLARRDLINENGGAISTEKAAELLGITQQAVAKRRSSRKLLGLHLGRRGYVYPVWQFRQDNWGTIPGLEEVLMALHSHDEWMQQNFFVSANSALNERRPIDLMREGQIAQVIEAAKVFGEHGAI